MIFENRHHGEDHAAASLKSKPSQIKEPGCTQTYRAIVLNFPADFPRVATKTPNKLSPPAHRNTSSVMAL